MNTRQYFVVSNLTRELLQESLNQIYEFENEWTNTGQPIWSEEQFMRDIPYKWDLSFVATVKSSVTGYLIASQGPLDQQTSRVNKLVIHPDHQRQGVGTLLMKSYIQASLALNMSRFELTAMSNYPAAEKLYKSLGYKKGEAILGKDGQLRNLYVKTND